MVTIENTLIAPLITEKATAATEKHNRFGFKVNLRANKNQIRIAVERLYDVKVRDVLTQIRPGKVRQFGAKAKKFSRTKIAYVKLETGQKIEFFRGI